MRIPAATAEMAEPAMAEQTIEYLLEGHRAFDRAASELAVLVDTAAGGDFHAAARARAAELAGILEREATLHMGQEEQVLFPALEGFLPRDVGPLAVLRGDHRDLAALLAALRESAEGLAVAPDPERLDRFFAAARGVLELVRHHFYKEERVLFPMVTRFLSPERDQRLREEMQAMEMASPRGAGGGRR